MNAYGFGNGDPVNYTDPFGLCGAESSKQERANRAQNNAEHCKDGTDGGVVSYLGIAFSLILKSHGSEFAYGRYSDKNGKGWYHREATPQKGTSIGISVEWGNSISKNAFEGESSGGCASYIVLGICFSTNESGVTAGGQVGLSTGKTMYSDAISVTDVSAQTAKPPNTPLRGGRVRTKSCQLRISATRGSYFLLPAVRTPWSSCYSQRAVVTGKKAGSPISSFGKLGIFETTRRPVGGSTNGCL